MDSRLYDHLNDHDGRGDGRHQTQQYPLFHPPSKQPSQPLPPRDRYRAPRHEPAFDRVEDLDYEVEGPFDSFNERLLHPRIENRQQLAAKGQARLSLRPSHPQPSYRPRDSGVYDGHDYDQSGLFQQPRTHRDLSQFTYSTTQPQEASSDVPLGPSSSPAFKAGQRRIEHEYVNVALPKSYPRAYEEEETYVAPYVPQERSRPQPQSFMHAAKVPAVRSGAPVIQGIEILTPIVLPDRLRTLFPYKTFNAVQSKCFDHLYKTNDNFVLASPTGSGKTVILEFAICRAIATNAIGQYKIVYQAPMKALCSERQRDWERKFGPLGLNCVELTGDSDAADLKNVQSANIIVTTPEKWDSITRKWKDHERLMRLIKLFLIDEVHILKEDRGAILEAVVSRMKTTGTDVRFVALSATIPNFHDVATWLGRSSAQPYEPAVNEKFGEEFRPVKLRKHVCGYASNNPNDFVFEKKLDSHLPEIIKRYSERKPIIVFCNTRNSTLATARILAKWWASRDPKDRMWNAPATPLAFRDLDLHECVASGVAFHHAGIDTESRGAVEKAFLNNEIGVICCTSTLAAGVNLPCHMVIIKNTVTFGSGMVMQEYSDLEIMQMLGRAGRPQFGNSAVGIIMTRQSKAHKYEKMVTGNDILESTLHLNLIDHLNAEISLGTIRDVLSARKWFASTFLYVRLKQNPAYYKLDGARAGQSIDEQLDDISFRSITLLRECNLTMGEEYFRCTEFGHIMARYYIHFDSMRIFMGLRPQSSISEILSAIAQAAEFESIRFRQGEKQLYKLINKSPCTRFPIPVDLTLPAHKVSLLIQAVLGAMDIPWDGDLSKHKIQYNTEANVVFKSLGRLIRCVIDCQITHGDSMSINNALVLERSITARVWDDSPSQLKQIERIGVVGIRKLVMSGIRSIEELECVEPHRIEYILGRNPPFGLGIVEKLKTFPKLRVSLSLIPNSITKTPEGAKVMVQTDIGFINETVPLSFGSKPVYVCMLAETSDGRMAHFARFSARQLAKGQQQTLPILLRASGLSINCYIMCDGIAGTQRSASVTPKIAPSIFPLPKLLDAAATFRPDIPTPNISRRRSEGGKSNGNASTTTDEFDDGIDDEELVSAASHDLGFEHIDDYANHTETITRNNTARNASIKNQGRAKQLENSQDVDEYEPQQLENGKWACNHPCKNKQACKHMCCKTGMDKPPKKVGPKRVPSDETRSQPASKVIEQSRSTQTKLQLTSSKRKSSAAVEELDLTQQEQRKKAVIASSCLKESLELHKLPRNFEQRAAPSSSITHKKPEYCYGMGGSHDLSFLNERSGSTLSSDYGDFELDGLPDANRPRQKSPFAVSEIGYEMERIESMVSSKADPIFDQRSDTFGDYDSIFGDAIYSITDSENFHATQDGGADADTKNTKTTMNDDYNSGFPDEGYSVDAFTEIFKANNGLTFQSQNRPTSSTADVSNMPPPKKPYSAFLDDTTSPQPSYTSSKPAPEVHAREQLKSANENLPVPQRCVSSEKMSIGKQRDTEYGELFAKDLVLKDNVEMRRKLPTPETYKGLEPWLFQEFGDCVEIVDE